MCNWLVPLCAKLCQKNVRSRENEIIEKRLTQFVGFSASFYIRNGHWNIWVWFFLISSTSIIWTPPNISNLVFSKISRGLTFCFALFSMNFRFSFWIYFASPESMYNNINTNSWCCHGCNIQLCFSYIYIRSELAPLSIERWRKKVWQLLLKLGGAQIGIRLCLFFLVVQSKSYSFCEQTIWPN